MIDVGLRGAIDMHVHTAPDVFPRKLNSYEALKEAARTQMRGLVLKDHEYPTTDRAFFLGLHGKRVSAWGSITLNRSVGGFNPWAVDAALKRGAKVVWLPTLDAAYFHSCVARIPRLKSLVLHPEDEGLYATCGRSLRSEVVSIVRLARDYDVVLSVGHLSPREIDLLAEQAYADGLAKLKVPHAQSPIAPDHERLAVLAHSGVWFSFSPLNSLPPQPEVPIGTVTQLIRAVGVQRTVLISDGGASALPSPTQLLTWFADALNAEGFSPSEMHQMLVTNPSHLLGLN